MEKNKRQTSANLTIITQLWNFASYCVLKVNHTKSYHCEDANLLAVYSHLYKQHTLGSCAAKGTQL